MKRLLTTLMALLLLAGGGKIWAESGYVYFDNGMTQSGDVTFTNANSTNAAYQNVYTGTYVLPNGESHSFREGLKLQSKDNISFTTAKTTILTVVQSLTRTKSTGEPDEIGNLINLDGTTLTNRTDDNVNKVAIYTETLQPGSHSITRAGQCGLLFIGVESITFKGTYPFTWQFDDANRWDTQSSDLTSIWYLKSEFKNSYTNSNSFIPSTATELTKDGSTTMPETKGLKFTASNGDRIMILPENFIGLRNGDATLTIPNVPTGLNVVVSAASWGGEQISSLTLTDAAGATATQERVGSGKVELSLVTTQTGDVQLTTTNWCFIYSIAVTKNSLTKFEANLDGGETLYGANDSGERAFVDATSFDYVPGRTQILQTRVDIAPGFSTTGIACNKTNFSVSSSNTSVISIDNDLNVTNSGNDNKFYFQNLKIGQPGTTTLTYTFNGTDTYEPATCSIEITINKAKQVLAFAEEAVTEQFELDKTYSGNTLTQSVGSGAVTYKSSDTDVATVDANTGVVTIKSVGTVTITATAAAYDNYDKTTASYTLTIASPLDWAMTKKLKVEPGTEITSVDGITLRFGGFTTNFGKGSSHEYGSSTDDFNEGHADVTGISGFYYNEGTNNATYESSTPARGWDRNRSTNEYLGKNLPIYGTFYVFEPKKAGSLTLSVLQTGSIQDVSTGTFQKSPLYDKRIDGTNSYHNGLIDKWDYKALYLIDERGLSVRAIDRYSLSTYNHPYEFVGGGEYAEGASKALTDEQRNQLSLKPHILGTGYDGTTLGKYLNQFTYPKTTLNEFTEDGFTTLDAEENVVQIKKELIAELSKNLTADEQTAYDALTTDDDRLNYLYPLKLKTENTVDIMENQKYGYWTLTKSHSMYTFPVEAGKTYYLFVDASKMGFSGFSFEADNTVEATTATIEGADKQTSKVDDADYGKRNCTVTLNRKLTAGQPNSLMLPFSMSVKKVEEVFGEGTVVLHVKSIDNQIHFVRHHYPMIVAGEPCLVYPTKTQDTWTIDGVTLESRNLLNTYEEIEGNDFSFTGCLEKVTMNKGSYWVRATKADGQSSEGNDIYFSQTNTESWMSNTRAFFQNKESNLGAKLTTAFLEDAVDEGNGSETTAISILQTENGTTISKHGVYTLDGRKLSDGIVPKGIYIVDGRKVVVK